MKRITTAKRIYKKKLSSHNSFVNPLLRSSNLSYARNSYSSFNNVQITQPLANSLDFRFQSIPIKNSVVKRNYSPNPYIRYQSNSIYNSLYPPKLRLNNSFIYRNSIGNKFFGNQSINSLNSINSFNRSYSKIDIYPRNSVLLNLNNSLGINNNSLGMNNNSLGMNTNQKYISNYISLNTNLKEPGEKLNISEFQILGEIGKGTYGKIYRVKWIINNKYYALKRENLKDANEVKKSQDIFRIIKDFEKKTNCNGIINLYSNFYFQRGLGFKYYELMEMCERDFEKEIKIRSQYYLFYTETELRNIMLQLISTLSLLQKYHITHRDIKPQNILLSNGRYKLSDFGQIRIMQREGVVVQRVRGSELYMSPILFYGLRAKKYQVRHNTYKSDVFSLGMCLFFAAGLSFNGPVEIREVNDMRKKAEILNRHLSVRYSSKLIKILHLMLQTEEKNRPDFILLEEAIKSYGL